MPDELETDLLRRFMQGDTDAFESLFKQFERDVYRWSLRIVREQSTAEDVLVEAFWRTYRGRGQSVGTIKSRVFRAIRRGQRHPADDLSRVAVAARVSPVTLSTEGNMRPHPYLRAYMAGIVVPTLFLLVIMAIFAYRRYYFEVPNQFVIPLPGLPLERAIIFPMAVVPNVWGAWNVLYFALRRRVRMALGVHGALLPLVLMPAGVALTRALDVFTIQWQFALPMVPIAMATYYLAWKYLVGFLNEEVGLA